ncbi:putative zinc-type alcohol dehydrogenase-like protein [Erwinia toletana]|uniref:Zinc-type alcohol dehydrogenase-like protein n=1 Tax=Winslowiella toletana TaxID=92490 RepID=A0ABS4PDP6_9GAMM|nr:NAD(P)-dependent alcohol dehydrogenase [Winslowiella toletana]MBP2170765.1 putative zinc-type alcohol dehydrogenase-like protein [Winslowiella toletana]
MNNHTDEVNSAKSVDQQLVNPRRRNLIKGAMTAAIVSTAPLLMTRSVAAVSTPAPLKDIVGSVSVNNIIPAVGYAVYASDQPMRAFKFQRRAVGPNDVAIEIQYCGVCHSDIHTGLGHWGPQTLPLVTGHELAGVVVATGGSVSRYRVGDRVGVGCMVDSCGICSECTAGFEQFCTKGTSWTYGSPTADPTGVTQGGYSNVAVVKEHFVISIPDNVELSAAGPIMCSAVTVYSPLRHWDVRPNSRIGIVGLGGLGHIAVKLAKAMGAEVIVMTTSPDKVVDAKKFGASDVIVNHDKLQMEKYARSLDFILDTVPYKHEMDPLIGLLKRDATLCLVGVGKADEPNQLAPITNILARNSFAGSLIGSIRETQDVIDFCSLHNISPQITLIPVQQINRAWRDVIDKKVRYRYVIDMTSIKSEV